MPKLNLAKMLCVVIVAAVGGLAALNLRAQDRPAAPADDAALPAADKSGAAGSRYFEQRTYHAAPDKLEALHARFRDHTLALFKKHDIENVAYWTPADGDAAKNTLVFLLAYPNKEAREMSWKAFSADPEWKKAHADSEADGPLVQKVDQLFMTATDYSPMK